MGPWAKLAWLFLSVALLVGATTGAFAQSAEIHTGAAGHRNAIGVLEK